MKEFIEKDAVARRRNGKSGLHSPCAAPSPAPAVRALKPASSPNAERLLQENQRLQAEVKRLQTEVGLLQEEVELERMQLDAEEAYLFENQLELETSRERYVELFEMAPVGYLVLDPTGIVVTANPRAAAVLGVPKLVRRSLWALVAPRDRRLFLDHLHKARRSGTAVSAELCFLGPNGSASIMHVTSLARMDAQAGRQRISMSLVDISDRRQAEEQLRLSEQRFRTMANAAPVMIWISGPDGGCTWFNKPWLDFVGRSAQAEFGRGWLDNVHPEDREGCLKTWAQALNTRQEFRLEHRLRRHDGVWRWVLHQGVLLPEARNEFAGFIGSCVDIHERKQAEVFIRAKQAELQLITDSTPVMLARFSQDLCHRFVNRAYAQLVGLAPEHLVGKPLRDLLGEAVWRRMLPQIEKTLDGQPVESDYEISFPGTGVRFVRAAYQPDKDESGKVVGWVAAITDITELKQEERRLRVRNDVNRTLALADSVSEAATKIVQALCESSDWDAGAVWLTARGGQEIYCEAFWQQSSAPVPALEADTLQRRYARGEGWAGTVLCTGQPRFSTDLAREQEFLRVAAASRDGLRSGFCYPIRLGDKVLGALECYGRQQCELGPGFLNLLASISDKLAAFIERKKGEMALRQSEEHMRHILETALDAVITIETDGTITGWNPRAEQIFGWSHQEALGRKFAETVLPPRFRSAHERNLQQDMDKGRGPTLEKRLELTALHRSGREFPVELAITPLELGDRRCFAAFVRDITERKRVDDFLRRSHEELELRVRERTTQWVEANEKLQRAFDLMNDLYHRAPCGYHSVDAEGRIVEVNDTALQWLGYTREELVGKKTVFDLQTPASRKLGEKAFRALVRGKPVRDLQLEFVRKDNTTLMVALNATPILDSMGRLVRTRSAFVDMTDRVRAEQALAQSEARLQAILDFSPAVIFLKDLQGRYLLVNREFERTFGLRRSRVLGRTDAKLFPRKQAAAFKANDRAVLRAGRPLAFEESANHHGGDHLSVVVKFPLRDSQGKVTALGGIAIDITARKKAEAALRTNEAKFRGFVESAPDAVVIIDQQGRIRLVNAQTERMFGYDRGQLLGQPLERLLPDRLHRKQTGHRKLYLKTPRTRPMGSGLALFGRHKDGSEFPVEISLSPLHTESGVLVCAAIRDITARKKIEDALRKSKEHYLALFRKARTAHRTMQRLSSLVLHAQEKERKRISRELHDDVGQILTAISVSLNAAGQTGPSPITLDARQFGDIHHLLEGAMATVHNFARELRPSVLDELGLIPALRSTVKGVAERTGLRIRLNADAVAEQLSSEEKLVFFRIAQESLNNVVKHAHASSVQVAVSKSAEGVALTIADDGKSFDMERDGSASRQRLGLLGMRERARLINGEFSIQARRGKGTTVRLLIPAKRHAVGEAEETGEVQP